MSSPDPDSDPEAAAMAAAMGFSSFGSAPAKKKRKFNAATDAFVEGQELEGIDRGGKKGKGSGGNTVALGRSRVFGISSGSAAKSEVVPVENEAEIVLEEGGEGSEEERPNYVDTSLPAPIEREGGIQGEEEGPVYVDTSFPPPSAAPEEKLEAQKRIDAILAGGQPVFADTTRQVHGLPARPPPVYTEQVFTQSIVSSGLPGIPRGKQGSNRWWEGYYDQGFNVNPWEHLEKEKGLSAVGSWLEYGHWDSRLGVKITPENASTTTGS